MSVEDRKRRLAGMRLFRELTDAELQRLAEAMRPARAPARASLMTIAQPGEAVYLILKGTVCVQAEQEDGTRVILAFLGPGDTVGEMSPIDSTGRSATVTTREACELLWLDRAEFLRCLTAMPALSFALLGSFSSRLRLANDRVQILASGLDVLGRLARQLGAMTEAYGVPLENGATRIDVRLTQSDLADVIGASRERVNKALGVLRRSSLVRVDPGFRIVVLDREALRRYA